MNAFPGKSRRPSALSPRLARLGVPALCLALLACGSSTSNSPDGGNQAPKLTSSVPADGATAVLFDSTVSAVFDTPMTALDNTTFTLKQGTTPVSGTVSSSADGMTATFTPSTSLAASTVYTATITSGATSAAGTAFAADHSWSFTTGTAAQQPPAVTSTYPLDAQTAVPLNARLSAVFSKPMAALSATTFTLKQGTTAVSGTVATSADGTTATFAPSASLTAGTVYTASITAAAASAAGAALGADHTWTFTTGTTADTTAPVVSATTPAAGSTGVAVNTKVLATFSKAMDPLTIVSANFTVTQGATPVAGTVSYGPGTNATFKPTSALAASTLYTATLATAVKDATGNALASAFTWTFTTGSTVALGPAVVGLGTAGNFAVLAKSAISSVPASAITGDIGVSPAAATFITGFSLVADSTNVFSTSPQITGKAYAANYAVPTPSNLTTAVGNMESAYTDAASRPTPDFLELGTGNIGGKTLTPGLYKWTSTVTLPADATISGGANDVWIFQTTKDITVSANKHITLAGGAQAKNIFWQVAGKVTMGAGAHFEGILLCKTDVTLQTGATMNGRILAQTAVALQQGTVTQPAQ